MTRRFDAQLRRLSRGCSGAPDSADPQLDSDRRRSTRHPTADPQCPARRRPLWPAPRAPDGAERCPGLVSLVRLRSCRARPFRRFHRIPAAAERRCPVLRAVIRSRPPLVSLVQGSIAFHVDHVLWPHSLPPALSLCVSTRTDSIAGFPAFPRPVLRPQQQLHLCPSPQEPSDWTPFASRLRLILAPSLGSHLAVSGAEPPLFPGPRITPLSPVPSTPLPACKARLFPSVVCKMPSLQL